MFNSFCNDSRVAIMKQHPEFTLQDLVKEFGKHWTDEHTRLNYAYIAEDNKTLYERVKNSYINLI